MANKKKAVPAKSIVRVVREFIDKTVSDKGKAYRKAGSTFEVDAERAAELVALGFVKTEETK